MFMIRMRHQDASGTIKISLVITFQTRNICPIVDDNSFKSYSIVSRDSLFLSLLSTRL
jgi:hypothetical protein